MSMSMSMSMSSKQVDCPKNKNKNKNKNNDGWWTTKKRGRDDDAIAQARQAALQARRRKNNTIISSRSVTASAATGATASKKPRSHQKKSSRTTSVDSDDSSIEDFIVHSDEDDDDGDDDEDVVLESEESSLEEELVLEDDDEDTEDDETSDNDSDKDSDSDGPTKTLLPQKRNRPSKASQALSKASRALKQRKLPALSVVASSNHKSNSNTKRKAATRTTTTTTPKTAPSTFPSSEDDDDDVVVLPKPKTQSRFNNSNNNNNSSSNNNNTKLKVVSHQNSLESSDTDHEGLTLPPTSGLGSNLALARSKKTLTQALAQAPVGDLLSSPDSMVLKRSKSSKNKPKQNALEDSSSSDDEQQQQHKHDDDSEQERRAVLQQVMKLSMKKSKKSTQENRNYPHWQQEQDDHDDDDYDPEEKIALKQAMKLSRKEQKQPLRREDHNDDDDHSSMDEDLQRAIQESKAMAKTKKFTSKPSSATEEILLDTDEEEEEDNVNVNNNNDQDDEDEMEEEPEDYGEEYKAVSKEEKQATSVLQMATDLSAQVQSAMKQWSGGREIQGLIVDGAIALGHIIQPTTTSSSSATNNNSNNGNNGAGQRISQEIMKQACSGVTLSEYQLIGVNWLALLHGMKCQMDGKPTNVNGVLADEMGLGKTVQTIAFLAWLKHQHNNGPKSHIKLLPHLIAVPVSVLPNWMREFETFCPEMKVLKYHGSMEERQELQNKLRQYLPGRPREGQLDAILVPITYYQKEKSDDRSFLHKFRFEYLVVDEAHMLKNSASTRYRQLDKVRTQHRLLLTGTPVQNSPQELLNMLCFIMPLFASKATSRDDEEDDYEDRNPNATIGERMLRHFVDEGNDEQVAYTKLKTLFAPFVLRRKKADVIAQLLPPKERLVEYVALDTKARQIYDDILQAHVEQNGTKLTAAIGEHIFTNLRKAAHHPLLLRTRHTSPTEIEHLVKYFHLFQAFPGEGSTKERVAEELKKFNDFEIHLTALDLIEENQHRRSELERYILDESALFDSAKFTRLQTLLPQLVQEGHRILIFSGWTSCLDLLGCLMEHLDLKYLRMDGSCASDVRQGMIDEFNSDDTIPVFLLSTRACGLGINLTAADTCIMHDLDFNPFNDLQAEDRCHRIGQRRKVTVYKLVAKDTVDADIYEMQERKAKMNAAIMDSAELKKERKAMLQSALNQFLASPQKQKMKRSVLSKDSCDL